MLTGRVLQGGKSLINAGNGKAIETIGRGVSTAFPDAEIMAANFRYDLGLIIKGAIGLIGGGVLIDRFLNPSENTEGINGN